MQKITVVDYGGSNLRSVYKALDKVAGKQAKICVSSSGDEIRKADKIVFPGQGAIGDCMKRLQATRLDLIIREFCSNKPFLGICLGLQSLMIRSEEDGGTACLGILQGLVKRFEQPNHSNESLAITQKIPHMGWNNVYWEKAHPLMKGIPDGARFYFVHSYYVTPSNPEVVVGTTNYLGTFSSSLGTENIFATQFHPEKSSNWGLKLLENFVSWKGDYF